MATYELGTTASLVSSVVFSGLAIWQAKRTLLRLTPDSAVEAGPRRPRKWLDTVGLLVSMFLIAPIMAEWPYFIFVFLLIFASFSVFEVAQNSSPNRRKSALLISGFACAAWLSYGAYEVQLLDWKRTISGAPIRADLIFLAPLLYFATTRTIRSWKALRLISGQEAK